MATRTPDAARWNTLQADARQALAAHTHTDGRLSLSALPGDAKLDLAGLTVGRAQVGETDLEPVLADLIPRSGATLTGDLDVAGDLACHRPLRVGETQSPRPATRVASWRADPSRTLSPVLGTDVNAWYDLTSLQQELAEPGVALVHLSGAFCGSDYKVLAIGVQIDAAQPLALWDIARLPDPRDRAAWRVAAATVRDSGSLHTPPFVRAQNQWNQGSWGHTTGLPIEPFSLLVATPLPPGASKVVLLAQTAPHAVAWATLTVHLIPT